MVKHQVKFGLLLIFEKIYGGIFLRRIKIYGVVNFMATPTQKHNFKTVIITKLANLPQLPPTNYAHSKNIFNILIWLVKLA